ncbi:MAG: peptidoglycan DD-metalloendopeptidase family protein [Microcoleaceae cyanobacterium]
MKGTVPYNDPSVSTPELLQSETHVDSSQQVAVSSSKVYTSAACLGLALASGMLFPDQGNATTEPSGTAPTPLVHPSTDSDHSAASTTDETASEPWQPALLRNLSEMNHNSGFSSQTAAEGKVDKSLVESAPELTETAGSQELLPQPPSEIHNTFQPAGDVTESPRIEISRPSSNSWKPEAAYPTPQTVYAQPKTDRTKFLGKSQLPGTVVIESDLSATPISRVYNVTSGDTLAQIANQYQVPVEALIETNRLRDPNHIEINQRLRIPHQSVRSQTSPSERSQVVAKSDASESKFSPAAVPTGRLFNRAVIPSVLPSEVKQPLVQKPLTVPLGSSVLSQMSTETANQQQNTITVLALDVSQPKKTTPKPLALPLSDAPLLADERRLGRPPIGASSAKDLSAIETRSSTKVYTQRLRAEVNRLRAEYQAKTAYKLVNASWDSVAETEPAVAQTPTMVQLADRLRRTNPEFAPQADPRIAQQIDQTESAEPELIVEQLQDASELNSDEVVATAPLSSSAYDPLKNPAIGRIVSPELPPLLGPDAYLPGGSTQFKGYTWPSQGILTSGYGWRWGRMHRGIDIAGPIGTPIVAAAPGVVSFAGWNSGGYGNLVEILHPDGSLTIYAHNNRILVNKGQKVVQGQQISEMGSTGRSTGPHLHFEIHPSGTGAVNPMALLPQERSNLSQY